MKGREDRDPKKFFKWCRLSIYVMNQHGSGDNLIECVKCSFRYMAPSILAPRLQYIFIFRIASRNPSLARYLTVSVSNVAKYPNRVKTTYFHSILWLQFCTSFTAPSFAHSVNSLRNPLTSTNPLLALL